LNYPRSDPRLAVAKAGDFHHVEWMEIIANPVPRKHVPRTPAADRKSHGRSRISNGKDLLPNVDGRSLIARRFRDISNAILVDQGGADRCSESKLQLIRRFAACAVIAEQMEARLARGETINISEHSQLSSTLTRLAQRIGIERRAKDVTPTVEAYLRSKREAGA
jgi:hypothetical protein